MDDFGVCFLAFESAAENLMLVSVFVVLNIYIYI